MIGFKTPEIDDEASVRAHNFLLRLKIILACITIIIIVIYIVGVSIRRIEVDEGVCHFE